MHMNYFSSTVDYNGDDLDNVCPDIVEGLFAGPVTYGLGELVPTCRIITMREHIDKAFQNWNGSVYWIQVCKIGMLTSPSFGGPPGTHWYQAYKDAGFDVEACSDNGSIIIQINGLNTTIRIQDMVVKQSTT